MPPPEPRHAESFSHYLVNRSAKVQGWQILFASPSRVADVGSRRGFSGNGTAQKVTQDGVIPMRSLAGGEDAVEDVQHFAGFDDESGLLEDLAADAVAKFLAELQH